MLVLQKDCWTGEVWIECIILCVIWSSHARLYIRILECIEACAQSSNKNVRLATATALLNTASHMHSTSASSASALRILDIAGTIVGCGKYEAEPITRVLAALGTTLLIPSCGEEVKQAARERGMLSMLERVASGNDVSVAIAKEIRSILS